MLKRNRRKANRRKRSKAEVAGQLTKRAAGLASRSISWILLLAVVVGVPTFVLYGWEDIVTLPLFHVAAVEVDGNKHVSDAEVVSALGLDRPERSVFSVDPRAAEATLSEMTWVDQVRVERQLPDRIKVVIEEREIGGLIMLDQLYMTDARGVPFKPIGKEGEVDAAIVTGVGNDPSELDEADYARIRDAFALMARYEAMGLSDYDALSEVQTDPLTGYVLVTETRFIRVFLGEGRLEARLTRLKQVYEELDDRGMDAVEIRLDAERSLKRVAIRLEGGDDSMTK